MGIQNSGPQKFQEGMGHRQFSLSAFLHVFSDIFNFIPPTRHSQRDICKFHVQNHIESNALPDVWKIFNETTIFHMYCHIDSVGCVLGRSSRLQKTKVIKQLNLIVHAQSSQSSGYQLRVAKVTLKWTGPVKI